MTDEIECPLTANSCRHCSHEHMFRPYMKLDKDSRTGLFRPGGLGHLEIDLGHYCNNVCCWCDQLEMCPVPVNLIEQQDMIENEKMLKEAEWVKKEKKKVRAKAKRKVVEKAVDKSINKPTKKTVKKVVNKPIVKKRPIKVTKPKTTKKKVVTKGVQKRKL